MFRSSHRGFTLIELLVVIAIIAVLAVVVVLVLNPAELLRQSRDANRLSDMATLTQALGLYNEDQGGIPSFIMGTVSTTYLSVSDTSATTTIGDQCQGLGLPTLASGDSYHCEAVPTNRNIDGTGWIPINFKLISSGSPIGALPVDPVNQTSSNLFYTYTTAGTKYEVTTLFESQKYKAQYATNSPILGYPEVMAEGSSLSLSELYNPVGLIGWWPLNEGSGSTAVDRSGNGDNLTWQGTASGMSGYYITPGKIGSFAGYFNGSNNYFNTGIAADSYSLPSTSWTAWINVAQTASIQAVFGTDAGGYCRALEYSRGDGQFHVFMGTGGTWAPAGSTPWNQWVFVALIYTPTDVIFYENGTPYDYGSAANFSSCVSNTWGFGTIANGGELLNGSMQDVRIYNRALSSAEIQAIYNGEH